MHALHHQVLCPLVNVPMIDYTMEFLARNDVREVFVFCVSHAKQLEEYLQSSTWAAHMEVCMACVLRYASLYVCLIGLVDICFVQSSLVARRWCILD